MIKIAITEKKYRWIKITTVTGLVIFVLVAFYLYQTNHLPLLYLWIVGLASLFAGGTYLFLRMSEIRKT